MKRVTIQIEETNSGGETMGRVFSGSRFIILLAVIDAFILSMALLVYGSIETIRLVIWMISGPAVEAGVSKELALSAIKAVDILLLGTVIYIICLGLYKLFINEDLPVAHWLDVHSIDDLKHTLLGAVVIILSVLFLEQVIAWKGATELAVLGISVALVIAALAYFQREKHTRKINQTE
jgi:uncharacterized membrane protein YqhA